MTVPEMRAVLAEINKGQHPLMMDFIEFSYDQRLVKGQWIREASISPSHYSPTRVAYDESGKKTHDGWICTQGFWSLKTKHEFEKQYMRMVRCGGSNYLSYYQLTEDM